MKKLITLFIVCCGFSSLTLAADPAAGKTKAAGCFACHGNDGNSSNPIWPKLAGQNASYLEKQMHDFKDQGRTDPTMNGMILTVQETDFSDIAAYFSSNEASAQIVDEKFIAAGEKLYRAGDASRKVTACAACHGPAGQGMTSASFPSLAGQHPEYVLIQLKAFRSGTRKNDPNGMMRNISSMMSDEQMEAVAHYIAGLHH